MKRLSGSVVVIGLVLVFQTIFVAVAQEEWGSDELIAAAKEEGELLIYTANQLESEQQLVASFNQQFPEITVEIVRSPGSRLFERIRTEAAANQLSADVIELSDVGLALEVSDLCAEHSPPAADEYPPSTVHEGKLYPKTVWGYVLAYNPMLITENPPTNWPDLLNPEYQGKTAALPAGSGGTPWSLSLFQRQTYGEDFWAKLAGTTPRLFESDSPLASAIVSGEVQFAPLKSNTIIAFKRLGAPIEVVYPVDGVALTPSAACVSSTAPHPNAAQLYLNWVLSVEGQNAWVDGSGGFSLHPQANLPEGATQDTKLWIPETEDYIGLRDEWVNEWNEIFAYR